MPSKLIFTAAISILFASCVSVPRDGGLSDVNVLLKERANESVAADTEVSETDKKFIRDMLAGEVDADRAVAIALANSPRVQVLLTELGSARAELIEASTIRNPILEAEFRFPADPFHPYELTLAQSLLDLLQLRQRRAMGREAYELAKLSVSRDVLGFAAEVRESWYELAGASHKVALSRVAMDAATTAADLAQRQHAAGNITDLDLENEQARYEEAKLDLSRAEEDAVVARERLTYMMGLRDRSVEWKLPAALPQLPAAEISDEELERLAATRRLDIDIARREAEIARRRLPLARVEALGEIEVDVHLEREAGGEKTTGPGIAIPLPIFNTGAAARARAEAEYMAARQRLSEASLAAGADIRTARERLRAARARVEYYRDVILPRRARIVALTQLEHNSMLVGIYDLLDAKRNETAAQRDYVDAQLEYWSTRNDLDRALNGIESEPRRDDRRRRMATSERAEH